MKTAARISIVLIFFSVLFGQSTVESQFEKLYEDPFFKRSIAAIDAYNLSNKEPIYSNNEKLLLHPASNMKILTSAAFLYFLGPEKTFNTTVYYDGEILDSVLFGDLYIKGGFDPDFTSDDLDSLINEIKIFGIKTVTGNLYGDVSNIDSIYWGKGWMWDDDPETDFPYMSSLIINDAAVSAVIKPGMIGEPAQIDIIPQTSFYTFENTSVTVESDSNDFIVTRDWQNKRNHIYAKGFLPYFEEEDTVEINLVNPELYFLKLTEEKLKSAGINLGGTNSIKILTENSEELFSFERPFSEVIVNLNKESDNLSTEMALRLLGHEIYDTTASAEMGIKAIDSLLTIIGLDPEDYRIVDGSGVSHYNLITAELLNTLLKYFYYEENDLFEILYNSFPIGGADGTLESRMHNSSVNKIVHAKTGTLSGVSCLSGYLKNNNGDDISFSIMMQNYVGSSREARNMQDEICRILANTE